MLHVFAPEFCEHIVVFYFMCIMLVN